MITCELKGGCGNQLFQIFATLSYSLKYNLYSLFLDKIMFISNPQRHTYWNNLLVEMKENYRIYNSKILENGKFCIYNEKSFSYEKIPPPLVLTKDLNKTIIFLKGYFQSYKYFEENYNTIYSMFNFDKKKYKISNKFVKNNNLNNFNFNNTISIHFRLGDYKKFQDIHPIVPYEYYKSSIEIVLDKCKNNILNILYFHENNIKEDIEIVKNNIEKLKNDFPSINFLEVSNLEDWEELILMSCCHYNIIPNSSFSWWACYLNSYKDKIVVYPKKWFGESCDNDTSDLFPSDWICNDKY